MDRGSIVSPSVAIMPKIGQLPDVPDRRDEALTRLREGQELTVNLEDELLLAVYRTAIAAIRQGQPKQ